MGGLFGGGGGGMNTSDNKIGSLQIQTSAFGLPIPIVYGTTRIAANLIWYGDFTAIAHTETSSGGGKGGGAPSSSNTTYTYTTALAAGLCEGPIDSLGMLWASKEQSTPAAKGFTTFLGTYPQTPWGYLTTNHPSEALGYQGLAYIGGVYDLGGGASLPNLSVEVGGRLIVGSGNVDANPADMVSDFLSNANYGAGFPSAKLGSLTQFQNFCTAYGVWLSPAFQSQQDARTCLAEIFQATQTAPVWSEGVLKFIPYCETTLTANGATYTANVTPQYDLTDDDFLSDGSTDPIMVTRGTPADAFNRVELEFLNRANQYNVEVAEATDQANIEIYGLRTMSSVQAHSICTPDIARFVAQMILQRALYIRNTYEFKLGWKYALLEPMDIVTLTDAALGLSQYQVRITEITETEDGELEIKAEDFPFGTATAAVYPSQAAGGYNVNYNSAPADTNAPILFEAPVEIAATGLELWAAVCGGANWGGCEVWISSDDTTYKRVGFVHGPARMGTLTAGLNVGLDPDSINTLAVDLTQSGGALISGTMADADANHTLCYVDGELVSYETATLTAANKFNLTYLRRGQYGTTIANHLTGTKFARLDDAIFASSYSADQIGQTVYFKFPAFNIYGGGQQDVAAVASYTHVIVGPPPPANVSMLAVKQSGGVVVFVWKQISDYALKGYDIRYGAIGSTDWSTLTPLTESAMGTEMTNASVPPGSWLFAIRARDVADQLSPTMTTTTLTVTNENASVAIEQECPALTGTVSGFVKHWTGVLVPDGLYACSHYSNWEDFGVSYAGSIPYVPDPVTTATYTENAVDTGYNDTLRIWPIIVATPGPGVSGTPVTDFLLDYWLSGASDPNSFASWPSASAQLRYFRGRVSETPGTVPSYISTFTVTADKPSTQQVDGANVTAAPGGTAIIFSTPFHSPPFVTAIYVGSGALFASANNITATGFTLHIYNTSGTDVGGTANWTATGF